MLKTYQITDVEREFDLISVIEDYGFSWKENNKHIILDECPDCNGIDKLFIDKKSKMWACFKCSLTDQFEGNTVARGNLFSFLKIKLGVEKSMMFPMFESNRSVKPAGEMSFSSFSSTSVVDQPKEDVEFEIPSRMKPLLGGVRTFSEAMTYIEGRKITDQDTILKFRLMYDQLRKRLIFPAYNINGRCMGFQSRDVTDRHKRPHPKCVNLNCKLRYIYYFDQPQYEGFLCPACRHPLQLSIYLKSINSTDFPKTEFFYN